MKDENKAFLVDALGAIVLAWMAYVFTVGLFAL